MPKRATKASDNVVYQARMEAAKWNDRLGSREGASEVTGLDRTRIAYIELGTVTPLSRGNPDSGRVLQRSRTLQRLLLSPVSHRLPDNGCAGDKRIGGRNPSASFSNSISSRNH